MIFPGEHNDYLVCTGCGKIERLDIECPVGELEALIEKKSRYSQIYHELMFFGVCPKCG